MPTSETCILTLTAHASAYEARIAFSNQLKVEITAVDLTKTYKGLFRFSSQTGATTNPDIVFHGQSGSALKIDFSDSLHGIFYDQLPGNPAHHLRFNFADFINTRVSGTFESIWLDYAASTIAPSVYAANEKPIAMNCASPASILLSGDNKFISTDPNTRFGILGGTSSGFVSQIGPGSFQISNVEIATATMITINNMVANNIAFSAPTTEISGATITNASVIAASAFSFSTLTSISDASFTVGRF